MASIRSLSTLKETIIEIISTNLPRRARARFLFVPWRTQAVGGASSTSERIPATGGDAMPMASREGAHLMAMASRGRLKSGCTLGARPKSVS